MFYKGYLWLLWPIPIATIHRLCLLSDTTVATGGAEFANPFVVPELNLGFVGFGHSSGVFFQYSVWVLWLSFIYFLLTTVFPIFWFLSALWYLRIYNSYPIQGKFSFSNNLANPQGHLTTKFLTLMFNISNGLK